MEIVFWIVAVYFVLGVFMTGLLSQTPYRENGWIITTLLWPVFAWALFGPRR